MNKYFAWTSALLLLVLPVEGAALSGTQSIGPTGDYSSIGAAISAIQTNGLSGPLVLELQAAYASSVETFPLTFTNLGTTSTNTLTLRPQAGATALTITSNNGTATVDLNGASQVTLDGRPGGTGTAKALTIANTGTTGVALRFINGSSNDLIQYVKFQGATFSEIQGVVFFSGTSGASGNQNSTIDHCDIGNGSNMPINALYSSGLVGTPAQYNSGNTISNCNIFNFYIAANADTTGVRLDDGNTGWTITGNSFYQTTGHGSGAGTVRAIYINSSGNNFTVTGNFIGGSTAGAGGSAWTKPNGRQFVGIQLTTGTGTPSSVQGNTIQNMVWAGYWSGIYVTAGTVNIGTVTGNTIGSGTGTGSISVTSGSGSGPNFGIGSSSSGMVTIAGNSIGSITVNGLSPTVSASFTGIQVTAGTNIISNNTVGSTTTANSLNAATSSSDASNGQQVTGILSSSAASIVTGVAFTSTVITGNTVANLNNNYVGSATAGQIRGIVTPDGASTITGNTVYNLSTTSANTNSTSTQSVYGIAVLRADNLGVTVPPNIVSQNTVYSLANTAASAAVSVTGIYFYSFNIDPGTNVIARNLVHSLAISSSNASAAVNGMNFSYGGAGFVVKNNMVRVGLQADGTSTAGAATVRGIFDSGTDAERNFYHNSVYVGGTQTSGASSSQAFSSAGVSNSRVFQNNLFVNARANNGATSAHYAVSYGGTAVNPAGLTAGGNILLASGTGGMLGSYNNADISTLAAWQAATGQDATSAVTEPCFINPTGTAATLDLHLQASNPAEGGGIPIASVTDDFDGQERSTLTPADIGADAGNFTSTGDVFAPVISYPLLSNGSPASRVLTGWATSTGGVASGASAPRLYYKKSTDADAFGVANDATGNGWKYTPATGGGPFSFTLDYSLLNGGGVSIGDTIQYFVVAQDAANNLGSSPAGATASVNPPVQNVHAHGAVNSFSILGGTISSTQTVGSGGDYPSLSGAGGFFAALNGGVAAGDVVVTITSDLTEDGSVMLSQVNSDNYPPPSVTFQPDSATMRTISGDAANGLITLNGADGVIIDGSFGGSGRYLTFRNTSDATTLLFINDASGNTVHNCIVEGLIYFSTGAVTGNDNNLITGCQVRDLSTATGEVPFILIEAFGTPGLAANSNNTIANCELFNFNLLGIYIFSAGNESWTLSDNNIYEVNAAAQANTGIYMNGGGTNVITGNFIHDLLTTAKQSTGIFIGSPGTTTIARNRITALNVNTVTTNVYGIYTRGIASSTMNVVNNQITLNPGAPGSTTLYGLYNGGFTGCVVNAFDNSIVLGGTESGTASSWATLRGSASTHTARNNLFLNLRTGGTGSHFAAGNEDSIAGSYTLSNNVYAGTGATAANFMDFSSTGSAAPMDFATWQTSTGDTNSQAGVAGSGGFSAAMFVDAANGDLHLVPGGSVLVNALGIPIAGVTDDYDGDPRNPTTPSIGADEFPVPDIAVTQGGTLTDGTSTVDFGPVSGSGSSAVLTFTLSNPGGADLTSLAVTTDGTNPGDFSVGTLSSTSIPVGAGTASFSVTFTPAALGVRNAAIHIASNVSGARNPFDITLTGKGVTTIEGWRQQFFGVTTNSGNAADTFDFDHDGLPNLIEWACNLSPTTASKLPASTVLNGTNVEFTYTRSVGALNAGAIFAVEWSDTLANDWQSTGVSESVLSDNGTVQQVKATLPAGSAGHRFVHLKVTAAP